MITDYRIIHTKSEWDSVLDNFKEKDIYFEFDYFDLYRCKGEDPVLVYMETEFGKMAYPFMLRDISCHTTLKGKIESNKYFDIGTPYGYSGPLIESADCSSRADLIKLFYGEFAKFCKDHNIVSEFIKFSPLLNNHVAMDSAVEVFSFKKMAITSLQDYGDPLYSEVGASKRKAARKCCKLGLQTSFEIAPKSIDAQLKLYYETMNRKGASDFFFFSEEYFKKMINSLSDNILLVNVLLEDKVVGFGLCFVYGDFIHAHVAGVDSEYTKYSLSNLHYTDTIKWGHENSYKYFFSGGGLTSDENDSLYLYKKSFAHNSNFESFLGKKIWDKDAYDYLLNLVDSSVKSEKNFFPLYRMHL